jgi:hypothetical protein
MAPCRDGKTPFGPMDFLSFEPPEGKGSLGFEASRDGRSGDYLGRGRARIETGPSTTCARGFSPAFPPQLRHDRSRIKEDVRSARRDEHKLTSLAGRSPRTVETHYFSYNHAHNKFKTLYESDVDMTKVRT